MYTPSACHGIFDSGGKLMKNRHMVSFRAGLLAVLLLILFGCGSSAQSENGSSGNNPPKKSTDSGAGEMTGRAEKSGRELHLTLHKEAYQGAFTLLIPKGWKTDGGMVASGTGWNVVDLVENNIKFRVTSPDGKSFFGWYPKFYFQDPAIPYRNSMGMIRKQNGEVLNGTWFYPYMDIKTYVRDIVFRWFAESEFRNPRILGDVQKDPELEPWIPKSVTRYEAGYVNFETDINGVPCYGRIYTG